MGGGSELPHWLPAFRMSEDGVRWEKRNMHGSIDTEGMYLIHFHNVCTRLHSMQWFHSMGSTSVRLKEEKYTLWVQSCDTVNRRFGFIVLIVHQGIKSTDFVSYMEGKIIFLAESLRCFHCIEQKGSKKHKGILKLVLHYIKSILKPYNSFMLGKEHNMCYVYLEMHYCWNVCGKQDLNYIFCSARKH